MTIDETLKELDELLKRMENPASLEEAFSDYEKGIKMIRDCSGQIEEIEKKVIMLQNHDLNPDEV